MFCVCVTPKSRTLAKVDILNAAAGGDIVEVCLDHLVKDPDFGDLLGVRPKPILVSCRRPSEGGAFEGTDEQRIQLLKRAIVAKPDYIELDPVAAGQIKRFGSVKRVVSFTRLDRPEPRPADLIDEAKAVDADIVKFVWPTPTIEDAWPLLALTVQKTKLPVVAIGIGQPGLTFSLLALRHGAPWVYAALEPGMEVCEGQATLFELNDRHRAKTITPKTQFIGITGFGERTLQVVDAVNTSLEQTGHNARCLPMEVRRPSTLPERLEKLKINTVLPIGEDAELLGSLATKGESNSPDVLIKKEDGWRGYRTIERAALKALKKTYNLDWNRANVLVLGLSPLGETIARELAGEGAMVAICTVAEGPAKKLAEAIGCRSVPLKQLYSTLADVVVIADAALVAGSGRTDINPAIFRETMTVLDVTCPPELHPLGEEARARGAKLVDPMAIYAMHLDAVMKTLVGKELTADARAKLLPADA